MIRALRILSGGSKHEHSGAEVHVRPIDITRSHGNEPSRGAKIDEELETGDGIFQRDKT